VVEAVDDVCSRPGWPFARLGRADAVSPRETAKLYTLAFAAPAYRFYKYRASPTSTHHYCRRRQRSCMRKATLADGCVVEETSTVKAWRKDNKAVPRIFRDHDLRILYTQSSSPRCTATPSAKHVKNLGSLIWRLGESATVLSWTGPSEQDQYLCEKLDATDM
jgi:hypothetical protein